MTLNTLTIPPYLEAAQRISDELELRGFTTDNPSLAEGLTECLAQIIQETMEGNLIIGGEEPPDINIQRSDPEIEDEVGRLPGADGWEGDLQNQIT